MNFLGYLILCFVGFANQSNGLGVSLCLDILDDDCQNSNSKKPVKREHVVNTIDGIIQNYKDLGPYGGFFDAKLAAKNGYTDCVNYMAVSENEALNAFSAAEQLLLRNQSTAACEKMEKQMQLALNELFDAGVLVLQSLGDALALSNYTARHGLGEASQLLQGFGLELVNLMDNSMRSVCRGINEGKEPGMESINANRDAVQTAFAFLYELTQKSHQIATNSIAEAQEAAIQDHIENLNSEAAASDPDVSSFLKDLHVAIEDSITGGATADRVNKLKQSLETSLGDFAKEASEEKAFYDRAAKLADSDPLAAEIMFRREFEMSRMRIQKIISDIFLSFSAAGLNSESLLRKQIGKALNTIAHGNDEVTSGNRLAKDLTLLGLGLPKNFRNLVLKAAGERARSGKLAFLKRLRDASMSTINLL